MGYTGGKTENPTYGTVCGGDGHTEALKVEFDPRVISYDDLLNAFWEEHNPSGYKPKAQYKSAIWPTSESQKEKALASRAAIEAKYGSVHTDIEDEQPWWDAEEYHQKYYDRCRQPVDVISLTPPRRGTRSSMFERDGSADKPAISHRRAAPLDVSYGEHRHQTRPSPVFDFLRPARVD